MTYKQAFQLISFLLALSAALAEARVDKSLTGVPDRTVVKHVQTAPVSILPKVPDFASGGVNRLQPSGRGPAWTLNTGDTHANLVNHLMDEHGFSIEQLQNRTVAELRGLHSDAHNGLIDARNATDDCPSGL